MILKAFLIFIRDVVLFLLAWALFLPMSVVNFVIVACKGGAKGYFYSSAVSIDKFGNRELRTLWNLTLRTKDGYEFGDERETISSVLGKNQKDGTLTVAGKVLVWILDRLDRDHARKSIKDFLIK